MQPCSAERKQAGTECRERMVPDYFRTTDNAGKIGVLIRKPVRVIQLLVLRVRSFRLSADRYGLQFLTLSSFPLCN